MVLFSKKYDRFPSQQRLNIPLAADAFAQCQTHTILETCLAMLNGNADLSAPKY